MISKSLHKANITVAFAPIAAADVITLTAGAGAAISAAPSGTELFKSNDQREAKTLATQMAEHMQHVLQNAHLTREHEKITVQVLLLYPLSQ